MGVPEYHTISAQVLADWVIDARQRTLELIGDLTDSQLLGPPLAIINPLLWEIGHVAWFQEKWVLRHCAGQPPLRDDADGLYDSAAVPHGTRWDLLLPSRADTLSYLDRVRDAVLRHLDGGDPDPRQSYFVQLSVFHEDMHTEAFTYTRQTLGYARPSCSEDSVDSGAKRPGPSGPLPGDVRIPGGSFRLGASPDEPFVFDNEKWAHEVELEPFRIARAPVTQSEYAAFVEDGGYRRPEFWTPEGWRWRASAGAEHPVWWKRQGEGDWLRRDFDQWLPLEPDRPVVHVNWYEANAWCAWAGRRLPTEAEWELAAAGRPEPGGGIAPRKRRFPWGDSPPLSSEANLNWEALGCLDVAALPAGDSAWGCRQMIGNVWEWTRSDFLPYPGFAADPYKEYSQPWFGTHKVLRGGCWTTRARLLRNTWRNFYRPDRRDIWAGFRTCAREA